MPIYQDCTRSAHGDTAAEFCTRQMENVAQYPEQRNVRRDVDHVRFAVDLKRNACHICPRRLSIHSRFFEPRDMGRQFRSPTDAVDDQNVNLAEDDVNGILLVFVSPDLRFAAARTFHAIIHAGLKDSSDFRVVIELGAI